MYNFIGVNIKYLCEEHRLSQNEFGELFGLKQNVISAYIRQKANPQVETLQKICDHFNITLDDFVNRSLSILQKNNSKKYNEGMAIEKTSEPITYEFVEEQLRDALATKDKLIALLEAEVKRLKGNQEYGGKTG